MGRITDRLALLKGKAGAGHFTRRAATMAVAVLVALALVVPAIWASPPAEATYSIYFRLVGPTNVSDFPETGEYEEIWAGDITVPDSVTITCTSGEEYDLYVNSSDRYIVERTSDGTTWDRGSADDAKGATSVLAGLIEASQQGGFGYVVSDAYFPSMGFFIEGIAGKSNFGSWGWTFRVWNDDYAAISSISTDVFLLGYSGMPVGLPHNQLLLYWGGSGIGSPLKVSTDKGSVGAGEEFTATVEYFKDDGFNPTGTWEVLPGAKVEVGGETFTTDSAGMANIFMDGAGTYEITAEKLFAGSTYYVPSDNRTEVSVSGGDSSDWWGQTTQGDFGGGSASQVDTSTSPGDVALAAGGAVTDDYVLDGCTDTLGGEHFYDQFRIINGATLYVADGEVLRVHANYIEVDGTSTIDADGRGSNGGPGDTKTGEDGLGQGAGSRGTYYSGCNCGGGGGGAGHNRGIDNMPSGYFNGGDGSNSEADGGSGGYSYGAKCQNGDDTFYLGSGGGGGAGNGSASGGDGGDGGGCVVLESMDLNADPGIKIDGTITADGEAGLDGAAAGCGGGGGGSGGTILIKGKNISIADGTLGVAGADGGDGVSGGGGGGGGGGGHIKVFFESCGTSTGHDTGYGFGGSGANSGGNGYIGSGSHSHYWYDYTGNSETYSPILPYYSSGTLESSSYDIGSETSYTEADFGKIRWCDTLSSGTELKFQVATNTDNSTWNFVGPDGTSGSYYTVSGTDIWSGHDGDRYIKYKAFFYTTEPGNTATLSKVGITFTEPAGDVISFTVTDYGGDGILFGSLDPGQDDQPADGQPGQGTVTLTVGSETNLDVDVNIKGDDFTGPGSNTIAVGNVKYDLDSGVSGAATLTDSYVNWYSVMQPLSADDVQDGYHWISIPGGKVAGTYTSTFYYQAVKSP